jgi:polyisoprenyl-teichoic acid--peptidoglycan teichoic acid transferase
MLSTEPASCERSRAASREVDLGVTGVRLIPETRGGALWRAVLAAVIVIAFTAATTAVAGLLEVNTFTKALDLTPSIPHAQITTAQAGQPQTLLLIGSDHRAGEPFRTANTDTMMLVRLDANSTTINVLSVPRDLKVQLPGSAGGTYSSKINAAYSIGGPNLLVKVLKQQVFPGLRINHIIDVNFGGFEALVNAIGCVYTDVDHRYYNNTIYTNYSSINIQPGYQKLCGSDALSFVRFRHTDSDLVRNARQQDFLRWAKSQYGVSQLISNRDKLIKIFGAHAQTDHDLHTTDGLLKLFDLVAVSAGHTIKQIKFPAILQPCGGGFVPVAGQAPVGVAPCFVTAETSALHSTFNQFMTPTRAGGAGAKHGPKKPSTSTRGAAVTGDVPDGQSQVAQMHSRMQIYYPRVIATGSRYCTNATCAIGPIANSYPRAYVIRDQSGHGYPSYRLTLVLNSLLGQYYGIQGTTWQNPPILNGSHQTKTVNGKQLMVFASAGKVTLVAWKTSHGLYWVSNTLTSDLSGAQMIAIAASLTRG